MVVEQWLTRDLLVEVEIYQNNKKVDVIYAAADEDISPDEVSKAAMSYLKHKMDNNFTQVSHSYLTVKH